MEIQKEVNLVNYYRHHILGGSFVDLVPVSEKYAKDIVNLRNTERVYHNLNQPYKLTEEMQLKWIDEYYKRDNDIYWCILDKNGVFIGTYRVYDIDFDTSVAEIGSTIIYEDRAKERPYMIEATLMVYHLAFDVLNIRKIIAHIRYDNEKVRSFDKRLGSHETDTIFLTGIAYITTELEKNNFEDDKLERILSHWRRRENIT